MKTKWKQNKTLARTCSNNELVFVLHWHLGLSFCSCQTLKPHKAYKLSERMDVWDN